MLWITFFCWGREGKCMKSLTYLELERGVFAYAEVSCRCPFAPFCFLLVVFYWFYSPHLIFTFIVFDMVTCCGLIDSIVNFLVGRYFGGSHSWDCPGVDATWCICGSSSVEGSWLTAVGVMKLTEEDSVKIVGFFHSLSFKFLWLLVPSAGKMGVWVAILEPRELWFWKSKETKEVNTLSSVWGSVGSRVSWDSGVSPWRRLGNPQSSEWHTSPLCCVFPGMPRVNFILLNTVIFIDFHTLR